MNETLSREEELFDAARRIADAALRQTFLIQACDGDQALRVRVESLLSSVAEADQMFQECITAVRASADSADLFAPASFNAREEVPGDSIGPYRIVSKIGEGGCGVVYLAEQQAPVRRRVAVKVIKLGMDTRAVVARFNAERQALALMDHPNIAKVFDGAATSAGRPCFVMELVSGVKITDFCDKAELDLRGRLQLFVQVCQAIQHAHQKGVIHRDIKPSNVLVAWQDGQPAPKVIDFGVAKATDGRASKQTSLTIQSQIIGTPAYMSPEQAELAGLDIDTRSDIYSLGVLLYELLTGRTPFDSQKSDPSAVEQMRRALRNQEPPRPSTMMAVVEREELAAAAQRRHTEPQRLIALLRGDLDWILMKALEKDRAHRYQTANGLAMDIQRYLNNEPIVARPPSRLYQLERMVRRNRGFFAAIAAIVVVLVAGLTTSTWLWRQEISARRRAVAAEQREARLLHDAEAREKLTRAAILLNSGRLAEADQLVESLESPGQPTEGAAVFRALGEWHALAGRWKTAALRFESLTQADQVDGWDLATLDFLEYGVALAQVGDTAQFDRFHRLCFDRFKGATNGVVAERMLKINLLPPCSQEFARSLQPWARAASRPVDDGDPEFRAAWRSISLALFEYRRGSYTSAVNWCERCLSSRNYNAPRVATARLLLGMSLERLGRKSEAREELAQARKVFAGKFASELDAGTASEGFWFDWVFGNILLREAAESANVR